MTAMETIDVDYELPEELEALVRERGWTDGLPVHVPTRERVDRFVAASGLDPEVVVGAVAPLGGTATIGLVAVNAVMAGCEPEHLPVIVAGVRAVLEKPFDLYMCQVTTNPVAPLMVVNGPARQRCGVRSGRDALGPGPGGNGPIGRALRLVLRNIGGVGDGDSATHGSPAKYTLCIAEDEEHSPWEPLHVWLGYDAGDSVVTTIAVEAIIDIVPASGNTTADVILAHLSHSLQTVGTNVYWSNGNPVFLLTPGHARALADAGYDRRAVQEHLFEHGRIPLDSLPFDNIAVGHWTVVDGEVLTCERPEDIYLVVAGGTEGHHTMHFIGFTLSKATAAKV